MPESIKTIDASTRTRLIERYRVVNGPTLQKLIEASLEWLRTNQQTVNALNVFPVPDGDTGTNMVLTMQSARDDAFGANERNVGKVAQAVAHGALMGARGNSGVILSQLWRGFARALDDMEVMDARALADALDEARETAYKGVVRPVEGTILTVSKDIARRAQTALDEGVATAFEMLEIVVEAADKSVAHTPELLPVLKEAGVVDSGGKGLFFILEGMLRAAYRQPLDTALATVQPLSALKLEEAAHAVEPGQDWEVVVDFRPNGALDIDGFYDHLEELGTSIQLGEGDGMYRMHIHVADQDEYKPIEYIRSLGTVTNVAIENLMIQVEAGTGGSGIEEIRVQPVEPGEIAVVTVAPGPGIARVFSSLGVNAIIEGGQTMNPSTQEILNSFEDLPTNKVIILPNNKNIILAAQQASELTVKNVAVVPSVSIPQGISALFAWDPAGDFDATVQAMRDNLDEVQFAEITTATRSVEIQGVKVKSGQVIGLLNGELTSSGDSLQRILMEILEKGRAEAHELVTLYYGEDLSPSTANQLADHVRESYPGLEVEVHEGGQPHYQIILSIE
ncbi:MAG: DAK2 domain-containing protein [Anaerolineales bacterium]|nr:DAK2 domain-containing protein [Anaerolineales bacterium]